MNLILAVVLFVGGVAWVAWDYVTGNAAGNRPFSFFGYSPGWALMLLAAYNWVRWYASPRRRRREDPLEAKLETRRRVERREPPGPPDPTFDFSNDPPPPPKNNHANQPPSDN